MWHSIKLQVPNIICSHCFFFNAVEFSNMPSSPPEGAIGKHNCVLSYFPLTFLLLLMGSCLPCDFLPPVIGKCHICMLSVKSQRFDHVQKQEYIFNMFTRKWLVKSLQIKLCELFGNMMFVSLRIYNLYF